jgi:general secretion pathway protein M
MPAPWLARWSAWRGRWIAMSPRDRRLAALAALVLLLFAVWMLAVQPALKTLREASIRLDELQTELQQMQALATEVRELRAAPALSTEQSAAALKAASDRLGTKGRLSIQGERAVLTLNGAGSSQLREWLAEARAGARARPVEAQLTRNAQGFSGTIVLSLGVGQ